MYIKNNEMNKTIAGFLERNLTSYTYRDVFHERKFIQEDGETGGWYTFYNYSIETSRGNFFIEHGDDRFLLYQDGIEIYKGSCILDCLVKIRSVLSELSNN